MEGMQVLILFFIVIFILCIIAIVNKPITTVNDQVREYIRKLRYYNHKTNPQYNFPYDIYYINMDKDFDRKLYMEKQLNLFCRKYERIIGIDGSKINNLLKDRIGGIKFINDYPTLSKGEIGCILSHFVAIKTAYKDDQDIAMICEDDISFDTIGLIPNLKDICNDAPDDWEILQLVSDKKTNDKTIKYIKREKYGSVSAACYLINRKGMKKLLDVITDKNTLKIKQISEDYPPLGLTYDYIYTIVNTYIVTPSLFFVNNLDLESTIHKDHTEIHLNWTLDIIKTLIKDTEIEKYLQMNKRCNRNLDFYMRIWDNHLFLNNYPIDINYTPTYHHVMNSYYYTHNSLNVILDGEPTDLTNVRADLAIVTKTELLPKCPTILCPQFVFAFMETGKSPKLLLKSSDEVIEKTKFCCFAYSNCDERFKGVRDRKHFYHLMQKMSNGRVDNLGRCYNGNYDFKNTPWTKNDDIYKPYKFVIAFENSQLNGYITEKLIMPMFSRAIPIYLGAPDVNKFINTRSIIDVSSFSSFEECITYLLKVDSDDELYNSILNEPYFDNNMLDKDLFSPYFGGKFYQELHEKLIPYGMDTYIRPCQLYENKFVFLTISKTQNNYNIVTDAFNSRFFNECNYYNLGQEENKLDVILNYLNKLDDDVLIYVDPTYKINLSGFRRLHFYYEALQTYDVILFDEDVEVFLIKKTDNVMNIFNTLETDSIYNLLKLYDNVLQLDDYKKLNPDILPIKLV